MLTLIKDRVINGCFMIKDRVIKVRFMTKDRVMKKRFMTKDRVIMGYLSETEERGIVSCISFLL